MDIADDLYMNNLTITNGSIISQNAGFMNSGGGGGIHLDNTNLNLDSVVVSYCTDQYNGYGGGIYVGNESVINVQNCIIDNNSSSYDGGGVFINEGNNKDNSFINTSFF